MIRILVIFLILTLTIPASVHIRSGFVYDQLFFVRCSVVLLLFYGPPFLFIVYLHYNNFLLLNTDLYATYFQYF